MQIAMVLLWHKRCLIMANRYEFELGEIDDGLVEEYKTLVIKYCEKLEN